MARRHRICWAISFATLGLAVDAAEDRDAAAAGWPDHRLVAVRAAAWGCGADAVLISDYKDRYVSRSRVISLTRRRKPTRILRDSIARSPLYSGQIEGIGPRYCPSIEDKVVKFPDKTRHQLFLEPEGLDTYEVYVNGMSTSMPIDVQDRRWLLRCRGSRTPR